MPVAGLRKVEVVPGAGFVDVEVALVAGFPDTDLRRLAESPALGAAAAAAEGRNEEVEDFFAGAAPGVSVLLDAVRGLRAIDELVAGVVLAGLGAVDDLITGAFEVLTVVRTVEERRVFALEAVELGRGARGAPTVGGLPIEPVVSFGFGFGCAAAAAGGLGVEDVALEGRDLAIVGLVKEVAGFFRLAEALLDGAAGSGEAVGAGSSAVGGTSVRSASGVGGTSCTSGTFRSERDNLVPSLYFAPSSPFIGAGVETGRPDPATSWAVGGIVGWSLSAHVQAEALVPLALESFPVSCWAIARGLVASIEGLRGSGAAVVLPCTPATPAGLEVEFRFCDVSNFPIRFATEGRGRSSGSGLFREGKDGQRRVGRHGE